MNQIKIIFLSLFVISFINMANSKILIIENNNRLTLDDINKLTSFDITSSNISEDNLNLIIKDLVASDLINTVEFSSDQNSFTIKVYESLFINEIFINGNIKLKNSDILQNLTIKNKSFINDNKISFNSNLIENLYSSIGQENVIVSYYLEEFNDNSFNIIYEVSENIENFVTNISINGNSFLSKRFLKSNIAIKEKKIFTPLSTSNYINEYKINNTLSKIRNLYNENGFLDFSINYEVKKYKNNISLYLFINEGERYKIKKINFLSDNVLIKSLFSNEESNIKKTLSNEYFSNNDIIKISNKLNKELSFSNNSNLFINYSYSTSEKNSLILNFFVEENSPQTINKVFFYGNSVTKDITLRKQLFFKPGEIYNKRLIDKSIKNLIRRPYIDNVIVDSIVNDDTSIDLDINITEKTKSGNFRLGAAYSAQNGVATSTSLSDSNFYGTGNKLKADFSISSKSLFYDLSYQKFYLGKYNIDNTFRIFNNNENLIKSYGYKRKATGFDLALKVPYKYDISNDQYFSLAAGYEMSDVYSLSSLASSSVTQNSGKSNNFFFNTSYTSDTTNDSFNPTSGKFSRTTFSISPTGISDDDYLKILSKNNFYFNNETNDNSFFILSKLGIASGLSKKIKTKDSFSLGGDFKGFQYAGIGPRDTSLNYLGGTKMYQLTLGYSTPFLFDNSDTFIIKYFGTIGSIFDSEYVSSYNSNSPRASIGVSMDVMTPIGPLSFSLASPISKNDKDKIQTYDFSIGSTF